MDAYDGTTKLYVFDDEDPIILAYQRLFPGAVRRPKAEMPADVRTHARYPGTLFRVQAEIYRTYHMRDPGGVLQQGRPLGPGDIHQRPDRNARKPMTPTYVVATLPGESRPEFLLMSPSRRAARTT